MNSISPVSRFWVAGAAALFSLCLIAGHVWSATILAIDFGGGALQSGFQKFNISDGNGPFTQPFTGNDSSSLTVTIAAGTDGSNLSNDVGALNGRTRTNAPANSGSFTQNALLQDRIVSTAGAGMFMELSGLAPNTTFNIQVWGYDTQNTPGTGAKPGTFTLFDRTNGLDASLGTYTTTAGQLPTDNNTFSVTGSVTSDASGNVIVESVSNMDGTGIMNGFVLSTATSVPEPGRCLLLLSGAGTLLFWRRRNGDTSGNARGRCTLVA